MLLYALRGSNGEHALVETGAIGESWRPHIADGISADAAPGYVAALRETKSSGDGKELTNPVLHRNPKSSSSVNTQWMGKYRLKKNKQTMTWEKYMETLRIYDILLSGKSRAFSNGNRGFVAFRRFAIARNMAF